MTKKEAGKKYNIPEEILDEYASWGLCCAVKQVMGQWHYDDSDLEQLSMIMTLHDIGFSKEEVEKFMKLSLEGSGTENERMRMLTQKRSCTLDEIHFKEKQIDRLDYLRYKINKAKGEKNILSKKEEE